MCGFQRIVFHCQHHLNTRAIHFCATPRECFDPIYIEHGSKALDQINLDKLPDHLFVNISLESSLCKNCSAQARLEAARKEKRKLASSRPLPGDRRRLDSQTEKINELLAIQREQLLIDQKVEAMIRAASEDKRRRRKAYPEPIVEKPRTHILCASGECRNQAVFRADGRRGEFCRKHTCSAREWGCLHDVYPWGLERAGNTGDDPRFCMIHTCWKDGCRARVKKPGEKYCAVHVRSVRFL